MRDTMRGLLVATLLLSLTACSGVPKLLWGTGDDQEQQQEAGQAGGGSHSQVATSPEARADYEMPAVKYVGSQTGQMPAKYSAMLQDKAVTLDARPFNAPSSKLFSAVVDAMLSLNIPVDVVDSPNGIITSDWVRKGENDPAFQPSIVGFTRHSFIVRVVADAVAGSTLEVHTIGQEYDRNQWTDRPLKRNMSEELFSAVDELLKR